MYCADCYRIGPLLTRCCGLQRCPLCHAAHQTNSDEHID